MILETYLDNEFINECSVLIDEGIVDKEDINFLFSEGKKSISEKEKKYINWKVNRPGIVMQINTNTVDEMYYKITKAKTINDIDKIIKTIDKLINSTEKSRKARENSSNIIPYVDKKVKKINFDLFLRSMNNLKNKALKKKEELKNK